MPGWLHTSWSLLTIQAGSHCVAYLVLFLLALPILLDFFLKGVWLGSKSQSSSAAQNSRHHMIPSYELEGGVPTEGDWNIPDASVS